jgi:hypothetical protein
MVPLGASNSNPRLPSLKFGQANQAKHCHAILPADHRRKPDDSAAQRNPLHYRV